MFRPEDNEDLIGRYYRKDGFEYMLMGILFDKDDWWWLLIRGRTLDKNTQMLSCACEIETYGFELVDQ